MDLFAKLKSLAKVTFMEPLIQKVVFILLDLKTQQLLRFIDLPQNLYLPIGVVGVLLHLVLCLKLLFVL